MQIQSVNATERCLGSTTAVSERQNARKKLAGKSALQSHLLLLSEISWAKSSHFKRNPQDLDFQIRAKQFLMQILPVFKPVTRISHGDQ